MWQAYRAGRGGHAGPLAAFFRRYRPPLLPHRHTCVGLGLELLAKLPTAAGAAFLVSCEESIGDIRDYIAMGPGWDWIAPSVEKEHVMVAMHIRVEGRVGLMLCDPGYHVARVITVMADRCYPHTGWFTQSDEAHSKKEYNYIFNMSNPGYVEWVERETRGVNVKYQTSLVYVEKPFCNPIEVTEKRNLVYNFRSLLTRDQKGHLVAGIYFPVVEKDGWFTVFFEENSEKQRIKLKFSQFSSIDKVPDQILDHVALCNSQMNYKEGELLKIILNLSEIMADTSFINQVLAINDDICVLSADN